MLKKDMAKTYHHGDLRAALIEKALELVQTNQVHLIGFRELARQLNVSRTAPYRHFESVECLLAAAAEDGFQKFMTVLEQGDGKKHRDPRAQFVAMAKSYLAFAMENPAHYRLMFEKSFYEKNKFPEVAALASKAFTLLTTAVSECVGSDAAKTDTLRIASMAWAFVHGLARLFIDGQLNHIKNRESFISQSCEKFLKLVE